MSRKPMISHEDVQRALDKFRRNGGVIRRLPDQTQPLRTGFRDGLADWEQELAPMLGMDEGAEGIAPARRA